MAQRPGGEARDGQTQRLLEAFSSNPSDARRFATLEEHLYLGGAWKQLAAAYEARLSALPEADPERGGVLLRFGTLLDERLSAPRDAIRRYRELLAAEPQHPQGLARLRGVYAAQGEIASALQIAEVEEGLDQPARERARTLSDIASLWRGLGETREAERRYEQALDVDPNCDAALTGWAELWIDAGNRPAAVALHERRVALHKGRARLDALEQLATVLDDGDRVRQILREILNERSERIPALRRLITLEHAAGAEDSAQRLLQRLWVKVDNPADRVRCALEAATEALGSHAPRPRRNSRKCGSSIMKMDGIRSTCPNPWAGRALRNCFPWPCPK